MQWQKGLGGEMKAHVNPEQLSLTEQKSSDWSSQAFKNAFLNAALDCIVTMDQAGNITEWNKAAEKTFGYAQADAIGKKLADMIIPFHYREKHQNGLARYIATGEHAILDKRIELTALRANGEEFPIELTVTHLKFGSYSLFTGFMRDISERKKLEQTKVDLQNQLEKKVQQQSLEIQLFSVVSPVGIFHSSVAGEIFYVNPRVCEIMDQTEDVIKGLGWIQALHPEDKERILSLWHKTVKEKAERFKAEFRCLRQDGTVVWVSNEATAEKDETGQIKGYINALTDINEWKALEKARFDAIQQAEEQYRKRAQDAEAYRKRQEQFIDTMCHELRNPLNGIYGNVSLLDINLAAMEKLIETIEPAKFPEHVQQEILKYIRQSQESVRAIDTCGRHQKVITDDVLSLSKLEAGKVELNLRDSDPKQIVQNVVDMLDTEVTRKKIQLYVEVLHNDMRVIIDSDRLAQILLNLLSNAIKFTRDKGKIWIRMSAEDASENHILLLFSVEDTGIGMTKEEKAKLFDRFMQATHATYSEYGGSGLGLAISKNLVELMGGKIQVESEKEVGSKFTFTIKCRSVPIPQKKAPLSLFFEPYSTIPQAKRRVLIAEDEPINQKVLQRMLEHAGHLCKIANNGQEAYDMTKEGIYDVILMDIQMPIINGFKATEMIRQREVVEKRTPVTIIGLSGNARETYSEQGMKAGMNDYLTKPYERKQLLEKIALYTEPSATSSLRI